MTIILYDYYM